VDGIWPQLGLITILIAINAWFAGTELAMVSLREGQLQRLAARGGAGPVLARLARDPNRFLATIQIGITLAGFLASASAAVAIAEPLEEPLSFLGGAARPVAIVLVTVALSFLTLVFGELAPKRIAMQKAERWGLLAARPVAFLAQIARPAVWILSVSADVVVRLMGGDPTRGREDVTEEEILDMVATQTQFTPQQRVIIAGAVEMSTRTLREVLRPRMDVVVLGEDTSAEEGVAILIESGHSRAPVAAHGDLDQVSGVVHLRDLVGRAGTVADFAGSPLVFPESARVLEALRGMQQARQHLAVVISEHGTGEGIVTIEDLIEELVGEIYDESDRDVVNVVRISGGGFEVPGRFPIHDLVDLGVHVPKGDYATLAGLILESLGRIPDHPGDRIVVDGWEATVLAIEGRAIARVRLTPRHRQNLNDGADDTNEKDEVER
jgi:putative hemolysin